VIVPGTGSGKPAYALSSASYGFKLEISIDPGRPCDCCFRGCCRQCEVCNEEGGVCDPVDGTCHCFSGWAGLDCSIRPLISTILPQYTRVIDAFNGLVTVTLSGKGTLHFHECSLYSAIPTPTTFCLPTHLIVQSIPKNSFAGFGTAASVASGQQTTLNIARVKIGESFCSYNRSDFLDLADNFNPE
jgi:hypothetical protein